MTKDPRQGFCATQLPVTGTRDDLHCFIHFFNNEIYNNYIYLLPTNALGTHCCLYNLELHQPDFVPIG